MPTDLYLGYLVTAVQEATTIRITQFKKSCRFYIKKPNGTVMTFTIALPWETIETDAPELWAALEATEYEFRDRRKRKTKEEREDAMS
ncbi:hypothetical protein ES703_125819 [subsurface metagenome]